MKSIKSLLFGTKAVPYIDVITEETREGIHKAYIPKYMFKAPLGIPRYVNIPFIRYLARTPYVSMAINTIIDELCSIEWDIIPNPDLPESELDKFYDDDGCFSEDVEFEINHIKNFLNNPNTNDDSFADVFIRRMYKDVLELNTGIVNKVFNLRRDMVEIVAKDAGSFVVNPDIYGMLTDRDEIIYQKDLVEREINPFTDISITDARDRAAYYQYGWLSGPMPVPFGRREIIWCQKDKRTDDYYGYSPVQILHKTLQMLMFHIESDLDYFNNNNVPKGIIGLEGSDSEEIKGFKEMWKASQETKDDFGNTRKAMHKVPIINYIPKFERIEFSSADIQLLEKQKWYSKLVWGCFGVNSSEVGFTDGEGVSGQIVQSKTFRKKAINPALQLIDKVVNKNVISEFDYYVNVSMKGKTFKVPKYVFKFNTFDVDEERNKAELYKIWLESGLKTINEIRLKEGDKPLKWGDEPMQKYNPFGDR